MEVMINRTTSRIFLTAACILASFLCMSQTGSVDLGQDLLSTIYSNDWKQSSRPELDDVGRIKGDWGRDFPVLLSIWWEVLLETSDATEEAEFIALSKKLSASLDPNDESRPVLFKRILIHAYRARFELIQGHYVNGIGQLNACIDLIEHSFALADDYDPFRLTSGIYHYFVAHAYENYPLLRPYLFFLPEGDREKGISDLEYCARNDDLYLQTEARYFLMRIYLDLEGDNAKAQAYCDQLVKAFPKNLLFQEFNLKLAYASQDEAAVRKIRSSYRDTIAFNRHWTAAERSALEQRIAHLKP